LIGEWFPEMARVGNRHNTNNLCLVKHRRRHTQQQNNPASPFGLTTVFVLCFAFYGRCLNLEQLHPGGLVVVAQQQPMVVVAMLTAAEAPLQRMSSKKGRRSFPSSFSQRESLFSHTHTHK
jgi:hypothetical protein